MPLKQSEKQGTILVEKPLSPQPITSIQQIVEDASSWPVVDGVKQKDGFAYCDGSTLVNTSGTYDDFNTANGGLVLPNGPFRTKEVALAFQNTPPGWSPSPQSVAIAYSDSEGNWRLRFNIVANITSATNVTVGIVGVTWKFVAQPVTAAPSSSTTTTSNIVVVNTNDLRIQHSSNNNSAFASGDVALLSKPTWADANLESYPVISLQSNIANAIGIPEPTATQKGLLTLDQNAEGNRNYIINGNMEQIQRGSSFTQGPSVASIYTLDRWLMRSTGTGGINTISRLDLPQGTFDSFGEYETKHFLRFNQTTLATSNPVFVQRIEDVETLNSQKATVSFMAKMDANRDIDVGFDQVFGTGGSSAVAITRQTVSLTTSWQKISLTFDIPSTSAQTIGDSSYLELDFSLPDNTTFIFDITNVKLEQGTKASKFTRAGSTYAGELALCKVYYVKSTARAIGTSIGTATGASRIYSPAQFPVEMRSTPAVTLTPSVSSANTGTITASLIGSSGFYVDVDITGSNDNTFWLGGYEADAEL